MKVKQKTIQDKDSNIILYISSFFKMKCVYLMYFRIKRNRIRVREKKL